MGLADAPEIRNLPWRANRRRHMDRPMHRIELRFPRDESRP
jgi:hypothetical protein